MTGPAMGTNNAVTMEKLEAQSAGMFEAQAELAGWRGVTELMNMQPKQSDMFRPDDTVTNYLYHMAHDPNGRQVLEWLLDLTLRQPLRVTATTIEETALRSATRQGINGVGEAIMNALAKGRADNEPKS